MGLSRSFNMFDFMTSTYKTSFASPNLLIHNPFEIKSHSREHVLNNLRLALDDFKFKFAEGNITARFKLSGISSNKSKGVIPWLSIGFLSSIFPRRKLYTSMWPFWAAECSGVQPSLSFGFMSIVFWRIKSQTAKWPLCAAKCKGVHPWSSLNYQVCISSFKIKNT